MKSLPLPPKKALSSRHMSVHATCGKAWSYGTHPNYDSFDVSVAIQRHEPA